MKKFIVANWKMLPGTLGEAQELLAHIDEWAAGLGEQRELSLVVCPPFVFLEEVARLLAIGHLARFAELGAQDIPEYFDGIRYVIVGHSSRRAMGETDEVVNRKLKFTIEHELVPIVCVGERSREGDWKNELMEQVRATFAGVSPDTAARCLIAYEPVWAISTNPGAHPDTPESAAQSVALVREVVGTAPRILYGGSVTGENARAFLERPEFSGVLVGGASVRAEEFTRILEISATL